MRNELKTFMYVGKGKVYFERMGEFIKVAEDPEMMEVIQSVEIPTDVTN